MVVPAISSDSDVAVPITTHVVQFNPIAQLPIKLQGNLNFGHKLLGQLSDAKSSLPTTITQTDSIISNPEYLI